MPVIAEGTALKHNAGNVQTDRQTEQCGILPAKQCYRWTDRLLDSKEEQESEQNRENK